MVRNLGDPFCYIVNKLNTVDYSVGKPLGVQKLKAMKAPQAPTGNSVTWSFPPRAKVGPPPDITAGHNGTSPTVPAPIGSLMVPDDHSDPYHGSSSILSPTEEELTTTTKVGTAQNLVGMEGELCCPSLMRQPRLVTPGGEHPSVTCSFL